MTTVTATTTPWQLQAQREALESLLSDCASALDSTHNGTDCHCDVPDCVEARWLAQQIDAIDASLATRPVLFPPTHFDCTRPDRDCDAHECGCGGLCPEQCHRVAALDAACDPHRVREAA